GAPDRPAGGIDAVEVAQACGLALAYVPSARNGPESDGAYGEDKGNAILSSLPLRDVVAVELPFEAGRKVAVGAEIPIPDVGRGIVAVSVHLDVASTLARTLKTGNRTRERQVAGLVEALELHGWGVGASVVGGDFNTWSSRDASLKLMTQTFSDSPPVGRETTRGPFPADHLFFRADEGGEFSLVPSSYRTVPDSHGSDHHARIFRIAVRREDGGRGHGGGRSAEAFGSDPGRARIRGLRNPSSPPPSPGQDEGRAGGPKHRKNAGTSRPGGGRE
ncbi:MAG: endonuclease/exonuclease/phosphatase family protein, partial [Longimicrobiales bacterium]